MLIVMFHLRNTGYYAPRVVYINLRGKTGDVSRVVYPSLRGSIDDFSRVVYASFRILRVVYIVSSSTVPQVDIPKLTFVIPKHRCGIG